MPSRIAPAQTACGTGHRLLWPVFFGEEIAHSSASVTLHWYRRFVMFYSRPKVEPFGWDLIDLPTPNGSRHFDALTSDRRPVDFRFGGGWLSVEIGPVDAPPAIGRAARRG